MRATADVATKRGSSKEPLFVHIYSLFLYYRASIISGRNQSVYTFYPETSLGNVYILDQALKLTGKVEDIAPGEKIYSVRFMGDRGYLVTFKNVDPLYVLDLKNPAAPTILGALKIPGFSDYLQPYDENHIIGCRAVLYKQFQGDRKDYFH